MNQVLTDAIVTPPAIDVFTEIVRRGEISGRLLRGSRRGGSGLCRRRRLNNGVPPKDVSSSNVFSRDWKERTSPQPVLCSFVNFSSDSVTKCLARLVPCSAVVCCA